MNRRLNEALTQNPARPTHTPRFGKTLTRLTSRNRMAAPRESSHRATQAEIHARRFSVATNGDLACFARGIKIKVVVAADRRSSATCRKIDLEQKKRAVC